MSRAKPAPDGHTIIDGARWHFPVTGVPTRCAVDGCERVLTPPDSEALADSFGAEPDETDESVRADG